MRALYERPTQLKRHPDGAEGEAIYQKRVPGVPNGSKRRASPSRRDGMRTSSALPRSRRSPGPPIWQRSTSALAVAARPRRQPRRAADRRRPQPGTTFKDAKKVALLVREVLDELSYGVGPRPRATGASTSCRIEPNWTFPEVRRCALAFAREVERRLPKKVTTAWWKEERGRRVFIDYNQNARDRTIASAYSVRARPDATVSAPVTWDELADVETEDFMRTVPKRFTKLGDVQAGIDDAVCDLQTLRVGRAGREGGRRRGRHPRQFPDARRAEASAALPRYRAEGPEGQVTVCYAKRGRLGRGVLSPCNSLLLGGGCDSNVRSFGLRGGRSSRQVQSFGFLSSRKRRKRVPCRKRLPCTLSYRTSATSFGLTACSSRSPVPHRLGSKRRSDFLSISGRTCSAIWSCFDAATAADPRSRARRRPGRGRAGVSRSSPAFLPPDPDDHGVGRLAGLTLVTASGRSVRVVEPLRDHPVEACGLEGLEPLAGRLGVERARREPEALRQLLQLSPPLLQRELVERLALQRRTSNAMNSAGISFARLTRLSAGWSRICIESKSRTPSRAMTISPSSAEWGGSRSPRGRLGEVAQQRPLFARPQRELAAVVLEDPAAVPWAHAASRRPPAARTRAPPPSAERGRQGPALA